MKLLLPFAAYLLIFQVYIELLMGGRTTDIDELPPGMRIFNYSTQAVVLMFSVYFLHHNASLIRRHKNYLNLTFVWSMVDFIPMIANISSVVIDFAVPDVQATLTIQRPIYGIACLALWFKVFYFLRVYKEIGHLVRNIFQIMYMMRYFWVMFLAFILMFTNTFYALTADSTFYEQLKYTFFISIRYFDTDVFD